MYAIDSLDDLAHIARATFMDLSSHYKVVILLFLLHCCNFCGRSSGFERWNFCGKYMSQLFAPGEKLDSFLKIVPNINTGIKQLLWFFLLVIHTLENHRNSSKSKLIISCPLLRYSMDSKPIRTSKRVNFTVIQLVQKWAAPGLSNLRLCASIYSGRTKLEYV